MMMISVFFSISIRDSLLRCSTCDRRIVRPMKMARRESIVKAHAGRSLGKRPDDQASKVRPRSRLVRRRFARRLARTLFSSSFIFFSFPFPCSSSRTRFRDGRILKISRALARESRCNWKNPSFADSLARRFPARNALVVECFTNGAVASEKTFYKLGVRWRSVQTLINNYWRNSSETSAPTFNDMSFI